MDAFLLRGGANGGFSGLGSGLEDRACSGCVFFGDGGGSGARLGESVAGGGVVGEYCDCSGDAEESEGGGEEFFHCVTFLEKGSNLWFVGVFFSFIVVRM